MVQTTTTGLLPAATITLKRYKKPSAPKLDFQRCIKPINCNLRPYSGFHKPFPYGCSIFCNHPGDAEVKNKINQTRKKKGRERDDDRRLGERLEEMLERYTSTTLPEIWTPRMEGATPLEGRKCLTPQPKPLLILDLRRTHSQETLSTNLGGRVQSSTFSPTGSSACGTARPSPTKLQVPTTPAQRVECAPQIQESFEASPRSAEEEEEEEEGTRRRGKQKKRKQKKTGKEEIDSAKDVIGILEPGETQVSTYAEEGGTWSGEATPKPATPPPAPSKVSHPLDTSLFDQNTLHHLRRYASIDAAEGDFRDIWRRVLKEALGASAVPPEEEMRHVREALSIPPCAPQEWLSLPRTFSRDSARFELPLDRHLLADLKPLEYLQRYVAVKKNRTLLYNYIFNKFREETETENRHMKGDNLPCALGQVMGRDFTEDELIILNGYIDITPDVQVDLRTWSGLCAFSERVFGRQFGSQEEQDLGVRPAIERADFESLPKWLETVVPSQPLKALLLAVHNS